MCSSFDGQDCFLNHLQGSRNLKTKTLSRVASPRVAPYLYTTGPHAHDDALRRLRNCSLSRSARQRHSPPHTQPLESAYSPPRIYWERLASWATRLGLHYTRKKTRPGNPTSTRPGPQTEALWAEKSREHGLPEVRPPPDPTTSHCLVVLRRAPLLLSRAIHQRRLMMRWRAQNMAHQLQSTARGFEPLRAEPNGFRVHLLSRSDTLSLSTHTLAPAVKQLSKILPQDDPASMANRSLLQGGPCCNPRGQLCEDFRSNITFYL